MYRVVVQCPASCLAILSDVNLDDGMLDKVRGNLGVRSLLSVRRPT
jgi:hypothetical protein